MRIVSSKVDSESGDALGRELFEIVERYLRRFCVLPSDAHYRSVALWVMVSHCLAAFEVAPRLVVRSEEKRSGKTRLMEVLRDLVWSPLATSNMSEAALFRSLGGDRPPTVLIDEADTLFGDKGGDAKEGLRGVINAGFGLRGTVHRVVSPSMRVEEFPVFAMVALAGIGHMPDTVEDRAVVVEIKRRKADEVVDDFRITRDGKELRAIAERLAEWGAGAVARLAEMDPHMPVTDRAADTWGPLISVADLIGPEVGRLAREDCVAMVHEAEEMAAPVSTNLRLLADIRELFDDTGEMFLGSIELCDMLTSLPDSPWGDWSLTPSKLSYKLKGYGIAPEKSGDRSRRGYSRASFADAFSRYLPSAVEDGGRAGTGPDGLDGVHDV